MRIGEGGQAWGEGGWPRSRGGFGHGAGDTSVFVQKQTSCFSYFLLKRHIVIIY